LFKIGKGAGGAVPTARLEHRKIDATALFVSGHDLSRAYSFYIS
jgi:hypothetical protein